MADGDKPKRQGVNIAAIVGLVVILLLAAAGVWFALRSTAPKPTPIGDVLGDLRTYDGQVVTVEGNVTETLNVFGLKTYQIQDDTGEIMVVTQRGLPQKGETISVTGIVNEMFNLGGVNMIVIQEPQAEDAG